MKVSDAQANPSVAHILLLLPADPGVELSASSPASCLPVHCHASHQDDNGLTLNSFSGTMSACLLLCSLP